METKICNRCRQEKPADLDHFHKYPRNVDGFRGDCKLCVKAQKKAWESANPEKVRAAKNRRNAANPEPNRNRAKQWRIDNPERYKENMSRWYQENRERVLAEIKADRKSNPEKYRAYELKEHFGLTLDEFDRILASQGGKCAACEATEPKGQYNQWAVDHDHACCPGKKTCGKCVRGILCDACNRALGYAKDRVQTLERMKSYLEKFQKKTECLP